jgi:trehalose synthase
MDLTRTSDLWWKTAVTYCLDVETFKDGNGDGCGDFAGLTQQIDHLARLGVTCLWLMPFFPTPDRDDGYDIIDFYNVDPRLGTLGDFVEFVRTAKDRGLRVISDLVVNHTSDKHPWFQQARQSKDSPRRDWYVWRDEPPPDAEQGVVFPDKEKSLWTYDEQAGQYYLHRFYSFQPDLDTANADVREEIARVMGFWLALGVSGFRLDAVPALLETEGLPERVHNDPRTWLRELRAFVNRRRGDAMLLGEVNVGLDDLAGFFGRDGDLLHMQSAFLLNQHLWLTLARQEAEPLESIVRSLPPVPPDCAWATFLRNHDELSLDKLTGPQRDEVFAAFAPEERMRLYGHGIRRRIAPMLGDDPDRLRMAWSLLFSLPGTPVLLYGDEIGMGEDLDRPDRMSVRVPMEWPTVARQRRDPDSLLNWMERLIRRRRERPEFGWGQSTLIETPARGLFAHRCDWEGSSVVAVHNLGEDDAEAEIELGEDIVAVDDLLEQRDHELLDGGRLRVSLGRYGYLWLRPLREGDQVLT